MTVSVNELPLPARISRELLPFVRQPAQYIGGEWNQLVRPGDWERAEIRVVVAFPDAYTIGMSHLGCQILYWLCNHTPGVCAERTYAPWIDAERVMRERGIPLFTWDTRQRVRDADILAISLQYEMCFTTVLNMLDLAGIPLRHADRMAGSNAQPADAAIPGAAPPAGRPAGPAVGAAPDGAPVGAPAADDEWPLVIVGGPQADNPEPMAEFVDLVVVGDGEHSMAAILEAYREYRRAGVPRREMIARLARRFPWCYAPNLYDVTYHPDGTIAGMLPRLDGLPTQIERCQTPDFESAPFPTRPLVPWVEVVHDRIAIEIMRGCPQVCRFCHAGYTKRPLHYRTPQRILDIAEEAYWATGQHEIGLLSLSTADYPLLRELAELLNARFAARRVNLSFPSLRIDRMLASIPWMANGVRKGGITMAVEAARDRLRRAIRKKVTDGNLMDGVREVYRAGWNRVKLYFMAGFPGEQDDDIVGIWELANAVSNERRSIGKPPAHVTASVGWLVPKPFTPFQWMAQPPVEYFHRVRDRLRGLAAAARHRDGPRAGDSRGRDAPRPDEPDAAREPDLDVLVSGSYGSADELHSEDFLRPGAARDERGRKRTATVAERAGERTATVDPRASDANPPIDALARDPGAAVAGLARDPAAVAGPAPTSRPGANRSPRGNVSIRMHDPQRSFLEAVFARGDRRLGAVIYEAWRRGARFDGWDECYDDQLWRNAFAAMRIDPAWYAHRERSYDEILPWDHIGLRIGRPYLEKSYDDVFEQTGGRRPLPVL